MTDTAADVATIADVLGIGQFAVIGRSGGTGHALATSATLPERVSRAAVTAPAAPYAVVGHDAFTAGMNERVRAYFEAIRNGEDAMTADFGAEDAELRAGAAAEEPDQALIFEETRQGLGGWIDDEIANTRPWGFHVQSILGRRRSGTTRTTRPYRISRLNGSPRTSRAPSSS